MGDRFNSQFVDNNVSTPGVAIDSDGLPEGWRLTTLGKVTNHDKFSLNPRDYSHEDFDYYSIPAYQEGLSPFVEKGEKIFSQKLVVDAGTVLFGKLNPRVPKVWQVIGTTKRRRIASTEFIPLFPLADHITSDFLYFLCWSDSVMRASQELVSGSTPSRQRVDTKAFLQLPVKLPPLPEQKAIAHVLRTVQQAKEATEKVITATRQLKQSTMKHLFTYGPVPFDQADRVALKETEIGPVPKNWEVRQIGMVGKVRYGLGQPPILDTNGVPMIRATNIKRGRITRDGLLRVKREGIPLNRNPFLKAGDVIVVRSGAYTGDVAMVTPEWEGSIAGYDLIISMHESVDPSYCSYYLLGQKVQVYFRSQRDRSAQPHLNRQQLESTNIPCPPSGEQLEIAAALRALDDKIGNEEYRLKALDVLFKSLIHHLMTGKVRVPLAKNQLVAKAV